MYKLESRFGDAAALRNAGGLHPKHTSTQWFISRCGIAVTVLLCAIVIAGCSRDRTVAHATAQPQARSAEAPAQRRAIRHIPLPDSELMQRLGDSGCERKSPPDADADTLRANLQFERECFRQAELIARDRLHRLQQDVEKTASAVRQVRAAR